jgi:hypothetical protein
MENGRRVGGGVIEGAAARHFVADRPFTDRLDITG